MNHNKLVLATACAIATALSAHPAYAQSAGSNLISLGWFHVMPQDSSTNETTTVPTTPVYQVLGLPTSFTSPNTT